MAGANLQLGFDVVVGLFSPIAMYVLKGLKDDTKAVSDKHDALAKAIPDTYARRDDVKDGFTEVKSSLRRIEDHLGTR